MNSPSYQDVVATRRQIASMIDELQRLDKALPNCKHDFDQMDEETLTNAFNDARAFIESDGEPKF